MQPLPAQSPLIAPLAFEQAKGFDDSLGHRLWNVALATVLLIFLSPILGLVALLVRLTSKGPILYRGARVGKHLQEYHMYKFRTLQVGAEQKIGARLLNANDPYFTPIGRLLKASRIDELPQLFNVIRGEMNLVGPRPVRPIFLPAHLSEMRDYWRRFLVRPGMTCISHVSGGFYSPTRQRLRHDLLYIEKRSLWLDLQILFWTFIKVAGGWLQPSLFLLFFFLLGSYLPPGMMRHFYVRLGGEAYNIFYVLIVLITGILVGRQIQLSRFVIYRSPFSWFIPAFAVLGVLNTFFAAHRFAALRGTGFLFATGVIPGFIIIHSKISGTLASRVLRVLAISGGGTSLLGLMFWATSLIGHLRAAPATVGWVDMLRSAPRATGIFVDPSVFGGYVVIAVPVVFMLAGRSSSGWRLFWAGLAFLAVAAILLSQSRVSITALLLCGSLALWKYYRRWVFVLFIAVLIGAFAALALLTPRRFTPAAVVAHSHVYVQQAVTSVSAMKPAELVWGAGAKSTEDKQLRPQLYSIPNLFLRLFIEYGALGVLLIGGLFMQVLAICYVRGQKLDPVTGDELWAIGCSLLAFLAVSNVFSAFYEISTQLFVWGLLALPCGIIARRDRRPGGRTIWRVKKHGDDFTGFRESAARA